MTFVNIALVIEALKHLLDRRLMIIVGGTDKIIVAGVHFIPNATNLARNAVNVLLRRDSRLLGAVLDLLTVLVRSRTKEHVISHSTLISGVCTRMLRECVARGADKALLLTDRAFAGADTLATSYALQKGVEQAGDFDLILCGKMAVDGDTAQIGPELAARLGIPHVTDVDWLEASEEEVTVRRQLGGSVQTLRVPLPAVLTVTRELNVPRLPSIAGVLRGAQARVRCCDAAAVGADTALCGLKGSPTQVVQTFLPQRTRTVQEITGTTAQRCAALAQIIKGGENHGTGH